MTELNLTLGKAFGWLVWKFMSARRRWQAIAVFALMLAGGVAELFTLGAVFPLLAVLAAPPGSVHETRTTHIFARVGIDVGHLSLPLLAGMFCVAAVAAAAIRILLAWASQKLVFRIGNDLGVSLYQRMLHQPYSFHVSMNSSRIIAEVNAIQRLLTTMFLPIMQAASALTISLFILAGLLMINPTVALVAMVGLGGIYAGVSLWSRPRLRANAVAIRNANKARVQAVQEGLGGIRDVLLDNSQAIYVRKYERIETKLRDAQAANALIAVTPRLVVEALGMVLIVVLALFLHSQGSVQNSLPVLAVLALGSQRLMPLVQNIYLGWTSMVGNQASFLSIVELLQRPIPERFGSRRDTDRLELAHELKTEHLGFRYGDGGPDVLKDIDIIIPRGACVGFVGPSGSGKSSLTDLLMGLLRPSEGRILIDGIALGEDNLLAWQAQIAHVPQHIFLSDGSILENIAFGVPSKSVDREQVREACRKAEVSEFVDQLPAGLDTVIGERGVRLSGGQRQRIGVARALYKRASVLILDEATSALDDITETSIIEAVNRLGDDYTVLMIAHRLTTLRNCDMIYRIDHGRIVGRGTYREVIGPQASSRLLRASRNV